MEIDMIVNLHECKDSLPPKKSYHDLESEIFDLKMELAVLKSDYRSSKDMVDFLKNRFLNKKLWRFL